MHTEENSPEIVVQRQLDAFNARNMDAWLATYAHDARQFELAGHLLAEGRDAIRARSAERFTEPNLYARLINRKVMGQIVIDHEVVTRTFPEGPGKIELVCIYVLENAQIQSATFHFGEKIIDPPSTFSPKLISP